MKKILTILLSLSLIFTFVACSNNESETPTDSESTDRFSFSDMLPAINDYFKDGKVTIINPDDGDMYCISVKNVTEDEFTDYKIACRTGNFSDVSFSTKTSFQARTTDNTYYLSLQYLLKDETGDDSDVLNITCGIVTSNSTAQDG